MAHEILVSAQGPLILGFGVLGPGLDNLCFELDWTGLGLGLGGSRTKGLGTGLDNIPKSQTDVDY